MNTQSKIKYFDLYGLRKEKSEFLETHNIKNTKWQELKPKEPHYFFVPKDFRMEKVYSKFISVKDIFKKYNAGIATGKDDVLVDFNKQSLIKKLSVLDKNLFEIVMQNYGIEKELIDKWYKELKNKNIEEQINEYNYRIFDKRFVIYNNQILQRARNILMQHLLKNNLSLVITKILSSEKYKHSFISNCISDRCFISNKGREANYFFPLHLYNTSPYIQKDEKTNLSYKNLMIFDKPKEKESNVKTEIIEKLSNQYKKKISPEEIFYYIYGILYSNTYREKYQEFLKIDFPKIPFTNDYKLFQKAAKFGKELIDLHLLKSDKLKKSIAKFPRVGTNRVEFRKFGNEIDLGISWTESKKKPQYKKFGFIKINDKQFFAWIPEEIWNYYIGGYQVLDKWLKDRTGKILSAKDANHYLKIISALKCTIDLQKQIDKIYPEVEKDLIEK